jgi:hypothetical protein
MSISSSWIHGNALTIESPIAYGPNGNENARLIITPSGPGAWVDCESEGGYGAVSWLHLPIPTISPKVSRFERFELVRVFLLFACSNSSVENVHVYDGHKTIVEFNGVGGQGLGLQGNFLVRGPGNTFNLQRPQAVKSGVGLSFLFKAHTGRDKSLIVATAGAEFQIYSPWLGPFRNP